jgi:maltose O-acetyltransferase
MSHSTSDQGPTLAGPTYRIVAKLRQLIDEDTAGLHPRLHLANLLMGLLPAGAGGARRAAMLRRAGFRVGPGTVLRGKPRVNGARALHRNLSIGRDCLIDVGVTLDLQERLEIGDRVTIGHDAMLLTSSHEIGPREHRAGLVVCAPVRIEEGAWLGTRCIILPGVTVGAGAIIAPGALVNKDVPPNARVAGTPAKVVELLDDDQEERR